MGERVGPFELQSKTGCSGDLQAAVPGGRGLLRNTDAQRLRMSVHSKEEKEQERRSSEKAVKCKQLSFVCLF